MFIGSEKKPNKYPLICLKQSCVITQLCMDYHEILFRIFISTFEQWKKKKLISIRVKQRYTLELTLTLALKIESSKKLLKDTGALYSFYGSSNITFNQKTSTNTFVECSIYVNKESSTIKFCLGRFYRSSFLCKKANFD